jgi:formamidopyrimidine-DNA glycosylase
MPELPEVETIVRRLSEVLVGKTIANVVVYKDRSFQGEQKLLIGQAILNVSRRAKLIRFHLPNQQNLLSHLKMTGQFIFIDSQGTRLGGGHPSLDWIQELPSKHTRVSFELLDSEGKKHNLYFNDMRIFGWIRLHSDEEVKQEFDKYGPDIHSKEANLKYFAQKLAKTSRKIKQVIMDNVVVSGVGNIYACDGLNLAKIHPERPANSLTIEESKRLLQALKKVINLGIKLGGATIDNYRNADGFAGKYQDKIRVYGRENESCPNCGGEIQKIKLGGRGTYFCSKCQV